MHKTTDAALSKSDRDHHNTTIWTELRKNNESIVVCNSESEFSFANSVLLSILINRLLEDSPYQYYYRWFEAMSMMAARLCPCEL
jgi:hypothetical protein